jgi:Na+-driven multidrug efflux pump
MRPLSLRLALLAAATGLAAAGGMAGGRVWLIGVFTRDEQAGEMLRVAWPMLCILQPINALVFVYDGILYATMSFRCAWGRVGVASVCFGGG